MRTIQTIKIFSLLLTASLSLVACGQSGTGEGGDTGDSKAASSLEEQINNGPLLASQNNVKIHQGYVDLLKGINPQIESQMNTPAGKKRLLGKLLEQELLYRKAVKDQLINSPKYQNKAALYSRMIYAQGALEEAIEVKAKEDFDKNKEKFTQVEVAHILIKIPRKLKEGQTEEEFEKKAKEAKAKLDGGAPWEEVLKEYSEDRITLRRGGNLGKLTADDRRAKRFGWEAMINQAMTMQKDQIAGPFKAKDGFHIIKIVEPKKVPTYEEVKNRLQFQLKGQVKKDLLAELTGGKEIIYSEELKEKEKTPPASTNNKTSPEKAPSKEQKKESEEEKGPLEKGAKKVEEGAKKTGRAIEGGAKKTGSAIKEGSQKAGKEIKEFFKGDSK